MKTTFNTHTISETIEQSPLSDLASQELFAEWCQINDSILPQFLPRKEWEKLDEKEILQQKQGKLLLLLPQDLQLWEMMEIIRKIDQNTFKNKPEKHDKRADELSELGRKFEKAGLYLANYFPLENSSEEAKLAQNLAQQFYFYGCSLQQKTKKSDTLPENILLSEQELNEIDQRLLGKEAYAKRLSKLGALPSKEQLDSMRKELLTTTFKALTKEGSKEQGEMPREVKKGLYCQLQEKVQEQLLRAIQTPETELYSAIFRRGKEKLLNEIPAPREEQQIHNFLRENLGIDLHFLKTKLIKTLNLPQLKSELEEVRKTGDIKLISEKELAIAKQIQRLVSSFEYQNPGNNPSEMVKTGKINCVGAALLGGVFLEELNINYLAVDLHVQASTILITTDDRWYRQDFTPGTDDWEENYTEITPNMLENVKERAEIQKNKEGLLVFKNWNPYEYIKGQLRVYIRAPEKGIKNQILNNTGIVLSKNKDYLKKKEAYRQVLRSDSNNSFVHNNLGTSLHYLKRYEEAIIAYQKAIELNPSDVNGYYNLGIAFGKLGKYSEAILAYKKAIEMDPNNQHAYNNLGKVFGKVGKYAEAIQAYQKFIQLADPEDKDWIEKAQEEMKKLQEKLDEKSE